MKAQALQLWCLVFISLSIQGILTEESCPKETCDSEPQCQHFNPLTFSAKNQSIFVIEAKGRLGNHLIAYGLAVALEKSTGIQTYLTQESQNFLSKYFDNVSVAILQDRFCNWNEMNFEVYQDGVEEFVNSKSLHNGHLIDLWPLGYKVDSKVCCPAQELYHFLNQNDLSKVRRSLVFKPQFRDYAQDLRGRAASKKGYSLGSTTFVGIHNRRTDYIPYMQRMFRMENPYNKKFFKHAMEYFREEYDRVIFFFVSDDMEWGKQNIKNKHKDIYFVGKGDVDSTEAIGYDLALLASCNHTIITWGSFSMWAAILSGGEYYSEYGVIVPGDIQHPAKKKKS
eukprot:maker-scaffold105_size367834-snap-gene-1.19 protein:Tk10181 transcript:maker-scaffold105_size367834-snap-gene-1.19-mRNA-1 annotation:"galactoside 2-alpha-l-fucosyltransferase 2"